MQKLNTDNNQGTAETMGRTLQGTAESPHPWLTTRHPISRDRTARQLRQTHRGRDQADHHDSEKWEDCRAGRDTSRSHQSRHRDSCQHAVQRLQQDLGEERGTGPVERRNHHQAAKERRPWGLQQQSRDHALVNARQDSQEGSTGEDEGGCRPQAPRPAGRLPTEQIILIRCTFQNMSCRIAHAGQLSESSEEKTGVRQGCWLSPFLFLLVIDWIMKTTTTGRNNGIQWTFWT